MIEIKKDQDAYREGLFARALGRSPDSNPYPADAKEKALWDMGWCMIDESSLGTTAPRVASPKKLVPDSGPGVVVPFARPRRTTKNAGSTQSISSSKERPSQLAKLREPTSTQLSVIHGF
jgi:hypothetical protein